MTECTVSVGSQNNDIIFIEDNYVLQSCIHTGKQHNLYLVVKKGAKVEFFIGKLQTIDLSEQTLREEKYLKMLQDTNVVPRIETAGDVKIKSMHYHYQITNRYGPSIKLCYQMMKHTLSIPTICMIAIQTLNALERIHKAMVVHRNLSLKKLLTANNTTNDLIINDFRYAHKYRRKSHSIYQTDNAVLLDKGNLNRFSSLNMHLGIASCPRDDLESLAYILIYLVRKGSLFAKDKQKPNPIKQLEQQKMEFIGEMLVGTVPAEFLQFFNYIRMSNMLDYPMQDYDIFRKLFRSLIAKSGYHEKYYTYPWVLDNIIFQNTPSQSSKKNTQSQQHTSGSQYMKKPSQDSMDPGSLHQIQVILDPDEYPADEQQDMSIQIKGINGLAKVQSNLRNPQIPRANLEEISATKISACQFLPLKK